MVRTFALIGASIRALEFIAMPLAKNWKEDASIVAICDPNTARAGFVAAKSFPSARIHADLVEMLDTEEPHTAFISSRDRFHEEQTLRCLAAGWDVIVEKPVAIDPPQLARLMKAVGKGADARVLFNFRASKLAMQIRRLVLSGAVGKVLQVQYESHLDTTHGADYFRRWHRRRENSGGLLVHKSSHDFDFIGWLLDDVPTRVRATGGLVFYGPENGIPAPRCSTCPRSSMCPFYFDLSAGVYRKFYKDFEVHDGYFRDGCVFSEDIDIEDRAEVLVEYRRGASLSYCIDAFSPYEGTRLVIVGSEGRLEAENFDGAVGIHAGCHIYRLRTYDRFGNETEIHVPIAQGEHEGADRKILCDILRPETSDPLGIKASLKDGILSSAVGVAAGLSIRQGGMVEIESLFQTP